MKIFFLSAFLLFVVAFTFAGSSSDTITLKSETSFLDESSVWTEPLESDVLSEKLPHLDSIAPKFQATPESVAVSRIDPPVFPSLEDGFSLDVSSIDVAALSVIDSFFNCLKTASLDSQAFNDKYTSLESFFAEGRLYSLVIFLHDIEEKGFLITSYIAGKPFLLDESWECPVRLFMDDGTSVDVSVHIEKMSFPSSEERKGEDGSESQLENPVVENDQWKVLSLNFTENQKEE